MSEDKVASFQKLLESRPDEPLVLYGLGRELIRLERFDEAARALGHAVEVNPDYTACYRELGRALVGAGRDEEADGVYRKGIETAERTGDLQAGKEMGVFLKRLKKPGSKRA